MFLDDEDIDMVCGKLVSTYALRTFRVPSTAFLEMSGNRQLSSRPSVFQGCL